MTDTPRSGASADEQRLHEARASRFPLLPLILLLLAVLELRTDLQLLIDHFTFTTLFTAIAGHPLAVVILVAQPSLWRRYGGRR